MEFSVGHGLLPSNLLLLRWLSFIRFHPTRSRMQQFLKNRLSLLLAVPMVLFCSCLQKDLDIDISQRGCTTFKLGDASVGEHGDPTCDQALLDAYCNVNFDYSGKAECLEKMVFEGLEILDTMGRPMHDVAYNRDMFRGDSHLNIDGSASNFQFQYTFPNAQAARTFSNITIYFHGEGYSGDKTGVKRVRVYGECSKPSTYGYPSVDVPIYSTNGAMHVKIDLQQFSERCKGADCEYYTKEVYHKTILSVALNGKWMLYEHEFNGPQEFDWPIQINGSNELMVICNQNKWGTDEYCTVYINESDGIRCSLDPDKAQVIRIF